MSASFRVEVSVRAALLAKAALELVNADLLVALLQTGEIVKQTIELQEWLNVKRMEAKRLNDLGNRKEKP